MPHRNLSNPFPPPVLRSSDAPADLTVIPAPQTSPSSAPPEPSSPFRLTRGIQYLESGQLAADIASYRQYANRKTGFVALDEVQPFYPGFYVLGGISSLGKTTFAHQLADNLAAAGEYVLYFSLEQNRFELFSKSLSRYMFLAHRQDEIRNRCASRLKTFSSIQIRRGEADGSQELITASRNYGSAVQDRMCILEGGFSATIENIVEATEQCIKQLHTRPAVIIDYLQIIAPSMMGGRVPDTKTSIDHIVHSLKTLQSNHDLTVLVLSSLNRMNYMTSVDFESFKESGGIEYTADVVWGLQLALLDDDGFYWVTQNTGRRTERSMKEKRSMIVEAKSATPRRIQLVCLKNRYGSASYTAEFEYYPAGDTFLSFVPGEMSPDLLQGKTENLR